MFKIPIFASLLITCVGACFADTGLGGTAIATSSFTFIGPISISSLTAAGNINFSNTSLYGIVGSTTNDNAVTGDVGEYVSTGAIAVTLTGASGIYNNLATIALTPGDWDVEGMIVFRAGVATGTTYTGPNTAYIGTSSMATIATPGVDMNYAEGVPSSWSFGVSVPRQRFSFSSTTTVYLVANAAYTGNKPQVWGSMTARRIR